MENKATESQKKILYDRADQLEKIGFEFKFSETQGWYQKGEVKMIPTVIMCASEIEWQKFIDENT